MSDKVTLTGSQRDELIKQYVQLHVDSMDMESLEQFVIETLKEDYHNLSEEELKIEISLSTPMYLNIFQVLPYRDPKDFQVIKLFPNKIEKNIKTK